MDSSKPHCTGQQTRPCNSCGAALLRSSWLHTTMSLMAVRHARLLMCRLLDRLALCCSASRPPILNAGSCRRQDTPGLPRPSKTKRVYLDRCLIFLRLRFKRRIRFFFHCNSKHACLASVSQAVHGFSGRTTEEAAGEGCGAAAGLYAPWHAWLLLSDEGKRPFRGRGGRYRPFASAQTVQTAAVARRLFARCTRLFAKPLEALLGPMHVMRVHCAR
jgi:hypothetical protein